MGKSGKVKKSNAQIRKSKHLRRNIVIFIIELIVFLILLAAIFFLYEFSKLDRVDIDRDKIFTNPHVETHENETEIVTQVNAEGEVIEIVIPATKAPTSEAEESDEVDDPDVLETTPSQEYEAPFGDENYKTIVVFGVDSRKHGMSYQKGSNSDVIILVSINNRTGAVRMCSVYRDTYVKLFGMEKYALINAAYSGYDVYEAINTLNMNLDLNITDYVCIDWSAAIETINLLGGANIELKPEFYQINSDIKGVGKVPYLNGLIEELVNSTGINSAQIPKEYFDGRIFRANGTQAVAYMRLRYTDSDLHRTQRQRNIINQIVDQAKDASLSTLLNLWDTVSKYIEISLSETDVLGLIYHLTDYNIEAGRGYPFQLYSGEDYTGDMHYNMITIDMVANVKQLHAFLYGDNDYVPSATIYRLDKELQKVANFKSDWTPNFKCKNFHVLNTDPFS